MDTASTGTRELLLFFFWSMFFEEVSFLFIDEFDAFYHFELSRELIKYVAKLNNVQAVFACVHKTDYIMQRSDCGQCAASRQTQAHCRSWGTRCGTTGSQTQRDSCVPLRFRGSGRIP